MRTEVLGILRGLPTANKYQRTGFEPVSPTPRPVLILKFHRLTKNILGEQSFRFPFLPSVLSPNITQTVE